MAYAYTCNQCGNEITDPELDSHLDVLLAEYHGFDEAIKSAIKDVAKKDDLGVYYPADEIYTDNIQLCPSCDRKFIQGLKVIPEAYRHLKENDNENKEDKK